MSRRVLLSLGLVLLCLSRADAWPAGVEQALGRAGANRLELLKALRSVPAEQQKGLAFLIANMPERDLRRLRADFLVENVALAYRARDEAPWGKKLPEEIFLNDVLPYANVDEPRDPWRKELVALCRPLVKDCRSPAEAAARLNRTIFAKLHVRYSTDRRRPNQSPKETIAQGRCTCTGLSILLCDACRSVGVPARLAGTPLWANNRGNHTWVEVWDGRWHFTGAAEPDSNGLDHAWFQHDASEAIKDSRLHAIYAASFRRTAVTFPLVWAPERKDVFAVNVTERYAKAPAGRQASTIELAAKAYFAAGEAERARWRFDRQLDTVLAQDEAAGRRAVWKAYCEAPIHEALRKDFEQKRVRYRQYVSPYTVKSVGQRPAHGWALVIAMHGGGGAPKAVNDSQWRIMQRYYRDQPSVPGYRYVALRAPNDTWNGFYDDYVPPLVTNLIRQFLLFGEVDSDKVFLIGYSHGGYGAFFIGPKIPDRFAAVHSSAAAPTDGAISPRTLRNMHFTFMVGDHDNAYGRRERCERFNREIQKLRADNPGDYPVTMELEKGFGHGGLPDRDKLRDMVPLTRNPVPRHLTWDLTDGVVRDFYWLSVPKPAKGESLDAVVHDNTVTITTHKVAAFDLYLDSRLIRFDHPLQVSVNGKVQQVHARPELLMLCKSLLERGDPELAFPYRLRWKAGE